MSATPQSVLSFWFGQLDRSGLSLAETQKRWWTTSAAFDQDIESQFGALNHAMSAGKHLDWLDDPVSGLAYILVLDQFCRNLYRGTAQAFSGDRLALAAAESVFDSCSALPAAYRFFAYMPYMHSESPEHHDLLIRRVEDEIAQAESDPLRHHWEQVRSSVKSHSDIIAQYGRYPHRNAVLKRESTALERAYLAGSPARFGQ